MLFIPIIVLILVSVSLSDTGSSLCLASALLASPVEHTVDGDFDGAGSVYAAGALDPASVVQNCFDGVEAGDGDIVVSCLSAEALAVFDEMLVELKADPEGTAAFALMCFIEITPDEVTELTAAKVVTILLSSEVVTADMPDLSAVEIGTAGIDGDVATVSVTMGGETDDIELVLEDGNWKITEEGLDFI